MIRKEIMTVKEGDVINVNEIDEFRTVETQITKKELTGSFKVTDQNEVNFENFSSGHNNKGSTAIKQISLEINNEKDNDYFHYININNNGDAYIVKEKNIFKDQEIIPHASAKIKQINIEI